MYISIRFIFDNSLLKKKLFNYILSWNTFEKKIGKNRYICKHSEYLSVHGVIIDLFLLFPSHLIFYKIKCYFFIMAYRWSGQNQKTLVTFKSILYSCKFSYLELEPNEIDGIFFFLNLLNLNEVKMNLGLHCFVYVLWIWGKPLRAVLTAL